MLVVGALAVIRYAQRHGTRRPWLAQLLARRTTKVCGRARQQDGAHHLGDHDHR
jgi:transposase